MAFTLTGGGDHEGADWTPDGDTIAGVHYGIGTFTVSNGETATVDTGTELEIYADVISVVGTIQGNAKGSSTSGTGGTGGNKVSGGGGGGYGGVGGLGYNGGATATAGGVAHGTLNTSIIDKGGAGGPSGVNAGGVAGGSVSLTAPTVTVSGTVTCNGGAGASYSDGTDDCGGGGGSGGGVLIVGNVVVVSGTISCNGAGGGGSFHANDATGGGAGGRIKMFYYTSINTSGSTLTVAGTGNGTYPDSIGADGTTNNEKLQTCTSAVSFGQTFTIGADSASLVSTVNMWVNTVSVSGDFTLTVYDTTAKGTTYGSAGLTISLTGENTFTFDPLIRLPDGESEYYMEIMADSTGDIELACFGISTLSGGYLHHRGDKVTRFDSYHVLSSIDHIKGAVVYNISDATVKSNVTNLMLIGAVHRVNADNTGTIQYTDDFVSNKYLSDYTAISDVTHDTGNAELDIADTGYITYTIDTKYIITGMPTISATIDITEGAPTIQISSNGSTWYDIDTAIVDDVSTEYDLDNVDNLSLKGLTTFYLRFDCAGAGTNTCSIKTFILDVDVVTVDVPNPVINTGTANTFTCDQDSDSGLDCEIELIYRDRKWT